MRPTPAWGWSLPGNEESQSMGSSLSVVSRGLARDGHVGNREHGEDKCLNGADEDAVEDEDGVPQRGDGHAQSRREEVRPDDQEHLAGQNVAEKSEGESKWPRNLVDEAEQQ